MLVAIGQLVTLTYLIGNHLLHMVTSCSQAVLTSQLCVIICNVFPCHNDEDHYREVYLQACYLTCLRGRTRLSIIALCLFDRNHVARDQ